MLRHVLTSPGGRRPLSRGRLLGACLAAAAVGLSAACGGAPATAPPAAPPADSGAAAGGHAGHHAAAGTGGSQIVELYAVQTATLGVVATDGAGRLLYRFEDDGTNPPSSHCTGECAQTWLPVVVPAGQEPQLLGVDADKVGKLERPDGSSQLTLGGWPLYVNRDDDGELKMSAPVGDGKWFVVTPDGDRVGA
jgi:predicted lipoprotein with Yx(FWY)xxD motif